MARVRELPSGVRGQLVRVLVVLFVVVTAWLGFQAIQATIALNRVATSAKVLSQALAQGDTDRSEAALFRVQELSAKARDNSDGPLWKAASYIPFVGRNAHALTVSSAVVDDVARNALPPIVDTAGQIKAETFAPRDGQMDVPAIVALRSTLTTATATLQQADRDLDEIETEGLLGRFRRPVGELKLAVSNAGDAASAASTVADLAESMFAADGTTRRYLLLFQTNAEVRALGGVPGSWAIIEAANGKLSMTEQGDPVTMAPNPPGPVDTLSKAESNLFTDLMARDPRNVTLTPDFPRAAELASKMLASATAKRKGGPVRVDGVLAVDPIALSYLLAGTGPVNVGDGAIDERTAVFVLLNKSYFLLGEGDQDTFFQTAARAVFDKVTAGGGNSQLLLRGFVRAAAENRILLWSAHETEQDRIKETGVSGRLIGDDGATPHVGVYFNDATQTKLQYYLDTTATARATECTADRQHIDLTTVLSSAAPENAPTLPDSLTGNGKLAPKGSMRVTVWVYGPYKGSITSVTVDGKPRNVLESRLNGRPVTYVSVVLAPGERHTVSAQLKTGKNQLGDGVVSHTPGVQSQPNDVVFASAC